MYPAVAVALPFGVVTTTSTAPAARAGVVTVTEVDVFPVIVAAVPPNVTEVEPVRFVPLIVTLWPPAAGPLEGETFAMEGAVPTGASLKMLAPSVPPYTT